MANVENPTAAILYSKVQNKHVGPRESERKREIFASLVATYSVRAAAVWPKVLTQTIRLFSSFKARPPAVGTAMPLNPIMTVVQH